MSIYYSGTFSRSSGLVSAICKQLKSVNLKPVKKIQIQFDPFHANAVTAREFLFHISSPTVSATNLNCSIKTKVVCDRSEPQININLTDSGNVKFLINNLSVLEILQQFNKHISSKVAPVEPVKVNKLTAKQIKKQGK